MKKYVILALISALILGFILGVYIYKLKKFNEQIAFESEYQKIKNENILKESEKIIKETSSSENKTTPNTIVIEKKYYIDCEHLVQEQQKIKTTLINKNENEFQIEYIGWTIQKFTPNEIVVYKEVNDFCDEHYLLKDIEGEIIVYALDKYGEIRNTISETGVQTKYLSDIDVEKLKEGIKIYGYKELNKQLEDFE